jgi:hypothetical protein
LKINRIGSINIAAVALGAFLTALPAAATTISFTTSSDVAAVGDGSTTSAIFGYNSETMGPFDPTVAGGVLFSGSSSSSFGGFSYSPSSNSANPDVINVTVQPTSGSAVTFEGQVSSMVLSGKTVYWVDFSGTPGASNDNLVPGGGTGSANYFTSLESSSGVSYDIKTIQQFNAPGGSGTGGKQTWLTGWVGVPLVMTPEPATLATTGLALVLAGLVARRKAKANG